MLQAVYTSAVTKAQYVRDATLADAAEAEKLLQRQSAAREQYDQGLAKLRATSRQLQSLASRVCSPHPWLLICVAGVAGLKRVACWATQALNNHDASARSRRLSTQQSA